MYNAQTLKHNLHDVKFMEEEVVEPVQCIHGFCDPTVTQLPYVEWKIN